VCVCVCVCVLPMVKPVCDSRSHPIESSGGCHAIQGPDDSVTVLHSTRVLLFAGCNTYMTLECSPGGGGGMLTTAS
jgi:hypothetical protein